MQEIVEFVKSNLLNLTLLSLIAGIILYIVLFIIGRSYSAVIAMVVRGGFYIYYAGLVLIQLLSVLILKITRLKRWTTVFDVEVRPIKRRLWDVGKEKPTFIQNAHRKKFKKVLGLSVLVFIFIAACSNSSIYEKWKIHEVMSYADTHIKLSDEINKLKNELQDEFGASPVTTYVKLVDGLAQGNVRAAASLEANEVGVAKSGEQYLYLDEVVNDGKRDWYRIRLENGKEGWISSAIATLVDVENEGTDEQ